MDRRTKDTLRGVATALGVSTGLLALACTAQTPDGYIHASFGGPLDVFSTRSSDVLSIGDGSNDATELAALLKGPGPVGPAAKGGAPDTPFRVAFEAGAAPNATTGEPTVMPSFDPTTPSRAGVAEPAILPSKPVVDAQGRIDCTGAVSCRTDPATNITTVTYPDGVVAVVQKINDLTVVAYKTITEALPSEIATLLPPAPSAPPILAAVAPTPAGTASVVPTSPSSVPSVPSTVVQTTAPSSTSTVRETEDPAFASVPSSTTPPTETAHSGSGSTGPSPSNPPAPNLPSKVKDALGGIADTVKGAVGSVGKALNPGASTKPEDSGQASTGKSNNSGQPRNSGPSNDHSSSSNPGGSEKSDQGDSGKSGSSGD